MFQLAKVSPIALPLIALPPFHCPGGQRQLHCNTSPLVSSMRPERRWNSLIVANLVHLINLVIIIVANLVFLTVAVGQCQLLLLPGPRRVAAVPVPVVAPRATRIAAVPLPPVVAP